MYCFKTRYYKNTHSGCINSQQAAFSGLALKNHLIMITQQETTTKPSVGNDGFVMKRQEQKGLKK